jgi:hypothetical protein
MGGGMDANNIPIGGLDLFNNVCYNWWGRTTDGNCHQVNFVNNYYKMGTDTRQKVLFTQDFEGAINPAGTDVAHIAGNIREEKNHSLTIQESALDKKDNIFNARASSGGALPTTYDYQVAEPLFPSYATIHKAKDAMKVVTSYAGATMPMRDEHHMRNVKETLSGSYTYVGSKSKIKGEIDTEEDITEHASGKGWEVYPEETRAADFDTDKDGMPDWYEKVIGSDPNNANNGGPVVLVNSTDKYYTTTENWVASYDGGNHGTTAWFSDGTKATTSNAFLCLFQGPYTEGKPAYLEWDHFEFGFATAEPVNGQPLPGTLATLLIGGLCASSLRKRNKK